MLLETNQLSFDNIYKSYPTTCHDTLNGITNTNKKHEEENNILYIKKSNYKNPFYTYITQHKI